MAEKISFVIQVYTPSGLVVDDFASSVKVPSLEGEIQFLPHHCRYVGVLNTGIVEYISHPCRDTLKIAVSDGICFFYEDTLVICADRAIFETSHLNLNDVKLEIAALETKLTEKNTDTVEFEVLNKRLAYQKAVETLMMS